MPYSASGTSPHKLLHNNGFIGSGSDNIINSGNSQIYIHQVAASEGEDVELDRLLDRYVSNDALRNSYSSPPECHPNTRTTTRNDIAGWLDENVSIQSPLLWLNGPAAVGKSVIAKTVSGFHDQIVATFFFSTSSDKTAATLFPTLAWQLARRIPDTRKHIIASLRSNDSLQTSQIEDQFEFLIIQPLKRMTTLKSRPVMVIDGVDECTDERMLQRFLRVLVQASEAGDIPVRFIICSRPEPRIHAILGEDRDVNSTTERPEPHSPAQRLKVPRFVHEFTIGILAVLGLVALVGLFGVIRMFGIRQLSQDIHKYGIFYLFRLIGLYAVSKWDEVLLPSLGLSFETLIGIAGPFGLLLSSSAASPRSEAHLATPIQRSRGFLQDVWELYRPIRLDIDKDATFPTSDRLADTFDKICPHPVISTIRIGFSQESKDDVRKFLTDEFNANRQPGYGTCPWFQPSDISDIVEASGGHFLYASTIVRLLDDHYYSPRNVLEMARRSYTPSPDLDKLYKAILKRAQEGSPDYQSVMDSLAILVFFAGNVHFVTVRKNFPVIEFLLGLEKGELNEKLSKMHSVLSIVPGESVGVYHRSFLEFLVNHNRCGENHRSFLESLLYHQRPGDYHISYSNGLRRSLTLMILAGFRYYIMRFLLLRQSRDDDGKKLGLVYDMITTCRHNFYGRFRFSRLLSFLHTFVHLLICSLFYILLFYHLLGYLSSTPFRPLGILATLLLPLPGAFIFSGIFYTLFLNFFIIFPFFHPFLHPLFAFTAGILFALCLQLLYPLYLILTRLIADPYL